MSNVPVRLSAGQQIFSLLANAILAESALNCRRLSSGRKRREHDGILLFLQLLETASQRLHGDRKELAPHPLALLLVPKLRNRVLRGQLSLPQRDQEQVQAFFCQLALGREV